MRIGIGGWGIGNWKIGIRGLGLGDLIKVIKKC
jgi:hypothetical protein